MDTTAQRFDKMQGWSTFVALWPVYTRINVQHTGERDNVTRFSTSNILLPLLRRAALGQFQFSSKVCQVI